MTEEQSPYLILYLAGPMTGIEDYNFPAFHKAAKALRKKGYLVISPAEAHGGDQGRTYAEYIRRSMEDVLKVDAIATLPGWDKSTGACLEVEVADLIGLRIKEVDEWLS